MFSVVDTQFISLQELVTFYGNNDVPNLERIKNIRLKFPINVPTSARRSVTPSPVMAGRSLDTRPHSVDTISWPVSIGGDSSHPAETSRRTTRGEQQISSSRKRDAHQRLSLGEKFRRWFKPRKPSFTARVDSSDPNPAVGPVRAHLTDDPSIPPALPPRDTSASIDASILMDGHLGVDFGLHFSSTDRDVSNSESDSAPSAASLHIANKPAAPLPVDADERASAVSTSAYYSSPRDLECQLSELLIANMQHEEQCLSESGAGRCECGLNLDEAELPRGWSLHLSTEPETAGRVFFTGPDGRCSWNLPLEVSIELDPEQQDRIRSLLDANEKKAASRRRRRAQDSTMKNFSPSHQPPARRMIAMETEACGADELQKFSNDGVNLTSELQPVAELRRSVVSVIKDTSLAASLEPANSQQLDSRHSVASRQEFFV